MGPPIITGRPIDLCTHWGPLVIIYGTDLLAGPRRLKMCQRRPIVVKSFSSSLTQRVYVLYTEPAANNTKVMKITGPLSADTTGRIEVKSSFRPLQISINTQK